jgi:ribosomal protein S24E
VIFLHLEITQKKENILLSRIELEAVIKFEKSTPSIEEVKQALSKSLEVEKDLIAVKKIATSFGHSSAVVTANQYFSKEDMQRIEPKRKEKKDKNAEAEAKSAK